MPLEQVEHFEGPDEEQDYKDYLGSDEEDQKEVKVLEITWENLDLIEEDKHPEKRMKQAWNGYIEERLPALRKGNPKVRRQQCLNMLHKEFEKDLMHNPVLRSKKIKEMKYQRAVNREVERQEVEEKEDE